MKQWFFDKRKRLYVDRNGVRLTDREIREALDEYIDSVQDEMSTQVAQYVAGGITLAALFNRLEDEVTALHGASGSIAYGGLPQMDDEKWQRIETRVASEISYLSQFRADVQLAALAGELSAEGIANRAGLYGESAYSEYMNQVIQREADAGVTLGRRVTEGDGNVCEGCEASATEEFIPLDEIPEIGSQDCFSRCRCEIEFQIGDTEFRPSEIFSGVIGGQDQYGGSVEVN